MSGRFSRMIDRIHVPVAIALAVALACVVGQRDSSAGVHHQDIVTESNAVRLAAEIDTSSSAVGVADSNLYSMSASELSTAMSELQSMGVTQIRVFLPWSSIETADGTYNWTQTDTLLDDAAAAGIAVDAVVTATPTWASSDTASVNGAPNSDTDYATFMAALASRYGATSTTTAKIAAFEIWNEPNGSAGWAPTPSAAAYTALLKAAYTAIKAVDPTAVVVAGALGAGVTSGTSTINPVTFLQEMYADGAAGYFDALSFHPYSDSSDFSAGAGTVNSPYEELLALRALMDANGDTSKLIWATEYGIPTNVVSQTTQAQYIADFLETWSSLTGDGPMFIYSLIDNASTGDYGLFTVNWTPKLAVQVIEDWIIDKVIPSWAQPVAQSALAELTQVINGIFAAVQTMFTGAFSYFSSIGSVLTAGLQSLAGGITAALKSVTTALSSLFDTKSSATATASAASTAKSVLNTAATTAQVVSSKTSRTMASAASTDTSTTDWHARRFDHGSRTPQSAPQPAATTPPAGHTGTGQHGGSPQPGSPPAEATAATHPTGGTPAPHPTPTGTTSADMPSRHR